MLKLQSLLEQLIHEEQGIYTSNKTLLLLRGQECPWKVLKNSVLGHNY
jgi:hypothetical protein